MNTRYAQAPVVLCLLALATWLLVIPTHDRLQPMDASVWTYVELLPAEYWLAVVLLFGAVAARLLFFWDAAEVSIWQDLLLIVIFAFVLFGTVSMLEGTPRFFDAYGHYSIAVRIDAQSDVNFPSRETYVGETPGAFLFFAVLHQLTGIPHLDFVLWYPVASRIAIAVVLYALCRAFGLSGGAVAAPLVFLAGSWFEELHVSPQSVGLLLYAVALLCLVQLWIHPPHTRAARWRVLVMFVAGSAVMCHPGSPIFIGFTLAALTLALLLTSRDSLVGLPFLKVQAQRPTHFLGLFLLASVGYLGWQINYSANGFNNITNNLRDAVEGLILRQEVPDLGKSSGGEVFDPAYALVNNLRELSWAVFAGLAFLLFLFVLSRGSDEVRAKVAAVAAAIAGCALFVAVPSLVGGQYIERAALFSLLPIAVLAAFAFGALGRGTAPRLFQLAIVGAVLAVAALLPVTRSASDPFEWPSPAELDGTQFATRLTSADGPTYRRIGNNSRTHDYYVELDRRRPLRHRILSPPLSVERNVVIATNPTGRGFLEIRDQSGDAYDAFVADLNAAQNRVYDAGSGINVYYVR